MTESVKELYGFLAPLMRQERAFLCEQVERARTRVDYLDAALAALDASFDITPPEAGLED